MVTEQLLMPTSEPLPVTASEVFLGPGCSDRVQSKKSIAVRQGWMVLKALEKSKNITSYGFPASPWERNYGSHLAIHCLSYSFPHLVSYTLCSQTTISFSAGSRATNLMNFSKTTLASDWTGALYYTCQLVTGVFLSLWKLLWNVICGSGEMFCPFWGDQFYQNCPVA